MMRSWGKPWGNSRCRVETIPIEFGKVGVLSGGGSVVVCCPVSFVEGMPWTYLPHVDVLLRIVGTPGAPSEYYDVAAIVPFLLLPNLLLTFHF